MYMSILFLNWFIGRGLQSSRTESMQLNGYPFNCVNSEKKQRRSKNIYSDGFYWRKGHICFRLLFLSGVIVNIFPGQRDTRTRRTSEITLGLGLNASQQADVYWFIVLTELCNRWLQRQRVNPCGARTVIGMAFTPTILTDPLSFLVLFIYFFFVLDVEGRSSLYRTSVFVANPRSDGEPCCARGARRILI